MTAVPIDHAHRRRPEPEHRRTGNKCRAGSVYEDTTKRYVAISRKAAATQRFGLRLMMQNQRLKGRRTGAPGTLPECAPRVIDFLVNCLLKNGPRGLKIAAETAARALGLTLKAFHKAKQALHDHGFLFWQREVRPTGLQGVRGPQVEQTPNRYWTALPSRAVELLKKVRSKLGLEADPWTVEPEEMAVMRPEARRREDRLRARQEADKAALLAACAVRPGDPVSG